MRSLRFLTFLTASFILFVAVGSSQPPAATQAPMPESDKPLAGAIIGSDAGHGGQSYSRSYTAGTRGVDSRMYESDLNLLCETELAKLLEEGGAKVIRTRTVDQRVSPEGSSNKQELHARLEIFEDANVHFFISVHHNAAPGAPTATGHTAIFKKDVKDDRIYKALAEDINNALLGVVPGPKRELIKGDYHLTRETDIPGTIVESGFMTNPEYDKLTQDPDYPRKEAEAIYKGALKYWKDNKAELIKLREELIAKRAANPVDPNTLAAIQLNPKYKGEVAAIVAAMDPDKKPDPAKIDAYIQNYKKAYVKSEADKFTVAGSFVNGKVVLNGEVANRQQHNDIINGLIAMGLNRISNNIKFPEAQKDKPAPTPEWKATPAP
ncbi:N-acetylmuramoyl-L-alanine amidase [Candidatus Sumerlaeota bacterium]|nr:N-acetylmuramoyl-L-alanine amidase [Candidatus Sumerlaeota bacterium]